MPQRARSRQSHLKDCRKPSKPQFTGEVRRVRLNEIAKINPKACGGSDSDLVSFLPLAEVSTNGTTSLGAEAVRGDVRKGHPYFNRGDVLVAKITPSFENGKIALANTLHFEGYSSTEFHVVRTDSSVVDSQYLLAFLRSRRVRKYGAAKMKGSAGQKRLPKDILGEMVCPLPGLEEQRVTSRRFFSVVGALSCCNRQLGLMDDLVKSRFIEMFGDPCDPGSSSAKSRIDSFCELRIGPFGSALHKEDYKRADTL